MSLGARTRGSLRLDLSGENLFAREFGSLGIAADPFLAPALTRLRRRPR
jgi:hypothetical protein